MGKRREGDRNCSAKKYGPKKNGAFRDKEMPQGYAEREEGNEEKDESDDIGRVEIDLLIEKARQADVLRDEFERKETEELVVFVLEGNRECKKAEEKNGKTPPDHNTASNLTYVRI